MRIRARDLVAAVILAATTVPLATARAQAVARAPRKVALLIGISDYAHFGAVAAPGQLADLQGPQNDVARLRVSLMSWGFDKPEDTRTLLGAKATKAGMEAGFRWLAERATDPGDAVVVFFSGHGSHAPDGADKDEPDGRDEGLVPFDAADAHDPRQLLLDDQIRGFLAGIRTQNVTIIIDACYSGTVTRGPGDAVGRDKGPKPAMGVPGSYDPKSDFSEARGHTLITAARSDQTAQELPFEEASGKVWIGAMTYHLTRALDGAERTRALRYDELIQNVRSNVRGALLPQVPQLEGDAAAVVFRSNQGIAAQPFVLARATLNGRITLEAGAIHGVRRTAVYDIFAAGEVSFAATPIAQARVDSVLEGKSFARFIDAAGLALAKPPVLPAGARAVLSRVPVGARPVQRLGVYFDPSATSLASAIAADSLRFTVTDSARAFAMVTRRRGVPEVFVRGIPLAPQDSDKVMRVGTGMNSIVGYQPAGLCPPLLRAMSIATMEGIANPASPAELTVDARLVPADSGPPKGLKDPGEAEVAIMGKSYDLYIRVDVPSDRATMTQLYMSAAIVGYTSDPTVLWPLEDATQTMVPLNTWVPVARRISVGEPAGSEILKVVVTSDQFDLRPLVASFGSCETVRSPTRSKGDWGTKITPITGWTTLERRIDIQKR